MKIYSKAELTRLLDENCGLCLPDKPCHFEGCKDDWPFGEIKGLAAFCIEILDRIDRTQYWVHNELTAYPEIADPVLAMLNGETK